MLRLKKITLVYRNAGGEKIYSPGGRNFFLIDFPEILSFLLELFLLFLILVFCLFVCLFVWCSVKLKMYILIHIRLCGRVDDKKISSGWFQDYFFIDLTDGRGKKTASQNLPHMSHCEKLFIFIPYLKKIENHIKHMTQFDTWHTLSSLDISNFLTDISMSRYQKIQL